MITMKHILFLLVGIISASNLFSMEVPCAPSGCIVFLRGPSCSSKSSSCKAVAQLDTSWQVISEDDYCMQNTLRIVAQTYPEEYNKVAAAIEDCNRYNAIVRHEVLYKSTATTDEKEKACTAINRIRRYFDTQNTVRDQFCIPLNELLMKDIFALAKQGHNVLVDSWFLRPQDIEYCKKNFRTYVVFAYAPLPVLLQRLAERNAQAHSVNDLRNKKFFDQVLNVFKKIEFTNNAARKQVNIGNKEEIQACFETIHAQLKIAYAPRMSFTRREITQEELDKLKQEVMQKFDGTPRKKYICVNEEVCGICDLVVNTQALTPKDVAACIVKLKEMRA